MTVFLRLVREPLVHFLLVGGLVFGIYRWVNPPADVSATTETIVISDATRSQLETQFEGVWNRPPTQNELDGLMSSHIREEILVREALKLSLDQNDPVIRQRLSQKMDFLLQSMASAKSPSDKELRRYFDQNTEDYRVKPQYGFDQVFLGDTVSPQDVGALLESLRGGADPGTIGQRSLLPMTVPTTTARSIDATFGTGFSVQLAEIERGNWVGPIESGYGLHLVRLTVSEPAQVPDFGSIRSRIETDWRRDHVEASVQEQIDILSEDFEILRQDEGPVQ